MRGKLLIAAMTIAVTGFVSAPSNAVVLYDSLSAASSGADSVTSAGPLYDSFSVGGTTLSFTKLDLMLGGGSGGTLTVGLYGNQVPSGGVYSGSSIPGSLLATLATLSSVPAGPSDVSISIPYLALFANTRYWIGLSSSDSNALWFFTGDFSGTGVGSEFNFVSSFDSSVGAQLLPNNPDGEYQMSITAAATPIPAALPLFASGLGALGLAGWRRKRKAKAAMA